jgi:hypothetical protein
MRYCTVTTIPVREKIAKWALSPSVYKKLLDAIDNLGENWRECLERVECEEDAMRFPVLIYREGDPPMDYLFDFSVLYHADEETLVIHDCDFVPVPSEEQ